MIKVATMREMIMIIMVMTLPMIKVATAAECAKQCGAEPQCNGWSYFAPGKR